MENGKPSETALMVAAVRARHSLYGEEPKLIDDTFALPLSGIGGREELDRFIDSMRERFAAHGGPALAAGTIRGMETVTCMRSRFAEDRLAEALKNGVRQLVVLGAGLDSLAYRRPDLTAGIDVIEVDYPSTQEWKRQRLAETGISVPSNVRFVPFDFEHQTLSQALDEGGVDRSVPTFFTWLGVQCYLSREAVSATLATVASFAKGSEIILDLTSPREKEGKDDNGRTVFAQEASSVGEQFNSRYTPDEFAALLASFGFADNALLDMATLNRRYLVSRKDLSPLAEDYPGRFVAAVVN
jgi:methyltransferase (TIGR00027 family)